MAFYLNGGSLMNARKLGVMALVLVPVSVYITGCGVTLEATRISSSDPAKPTPSLIPREGIVYALPKTELEVVQAVKLKIPTSGPLQDTYDTCRRACDAGSGNVTDGACDFSAELTVAYLPPDVRTVAVPDHSRLYQVSPSADIFQTLDFKFDIASDGVLDKADTSASNMTYEVVTSVLNAAVKVATFASRPIMQESMRAKQSNKSRSCYELSTAVAALTKQKTGTLTCDLQKEIASCLGQFDAAVESERRALNVAFDSALAAKTDSKLLDAVAANRRERIETAVSKRAEAAALYGLGEGKPKEATYQIIIPMGGPPDFTSFSSTANLGLSVRSGSARIAGTSDTAADLIPTLVASIKGDDRTFVVSTSMPTNVDVIKGDESAVLGGGYRYRIPVKAATSLTVYGTSSMKPGEVLFAPLIDRKVIAQYGPIAALPSKFKGKGGRVVVKHWPESGGIQNVQIGADAIPTAAVTDVVDNAVTQYKARKDKTDAAAAAAAAAAATSDPELEGLTRLQKILALKKQIKDLEDAQQK